jgi:hypothetical protein
VALERRARELDRLDLQPEADRLSRLRGRLRAALPRLLVELNTLDRFLADVAAEEGDRPA